MACQTKTMTLSKKDYAHVERATHEATKSTMLMKHGCVVAQGSKVISVGHNMSRNQFGDKFVTMSCSCHAEMDALRKIYKNVYKQQSKQQKCKKKCRQGKHSCVTTHRKLKQCEKVA